MKIGIFDEYVSSQTQLNIHCDNNNTNKTMAVFVICAILLSRLFFVNGVNNEVFNHCIRSSPNPGIVQCIGQQTLSSLQYLDKSDNFSIDNGFRLVRTDFERERSLDDFLVDDPTDFR